MQKVMQNLNSVCIQKNQQELEALLTNGVTVKVSSAVADGSVRQAQRKVELVQAEEQVESKVETLVIDQSQIHLTILKIIRFKYALKH